MIDAAFELAANQKPRSCLGLKLEPLSVGHLFLLREHSSAYVAGLNPTAEDLILSVFVCSQPHDASRKNLKAFWLPVFMRVWGWRVSRMNLAVEFQKFRRYWDTSTEVPSVVFPVIGAGREVGSPNEWRILTMLMSDFGYSEPDAMSISVLKANCLWATQGDRKGTLNLVSDRQRSFVEFARQMDAQKFGGKN